mmetsp:Transcript_24146/g.45954  ORF Transcript_24146/g.45954 Transcript_24146/m.45954 type:complete len:124 (+) Transcript_24146:1661-2032(+)|eukprot:scaffold2767_cov177-Amphora_coffeaeformis.AAC.2
MMWLSSPRRERGLPMLHGIISDHEYDRDACIAQDCRQPPGTSLSAWTIPRMKCNIGDNFHAYREGVCAAMGTIKLHWWGMEISILVGPAGGVATMTNSTHLYSDELGMGIFLFAHFAPSCKRG